MTGDVWRDLCGVGRGESSGLMVKDRRRSGGSLVVDAGDV